MPNINGLAILTLLLEDSEGKVLHHNFMHFEIISESKLPKTEIISVKPTPTKLEFEGKIWDVLDGLKFNGSGSGYVEYVFKLDKSIRQKDIKESYFIAELSAKELFVKDMDKKEKTDIDYMLGGIASPSANVNSYPMTDEKLFPSKVKITVNGETALTTTLPDDPADHRGVLSWHHQLKDRKLREAGSYGYLTKVPISKKQLQSALAKGELIIRIQTEGAGGIAVYGKSFGRYPIDPSVVMKLK
jgi:predicted transcriptional regulator